MTDTQSLVEQLEAEGYRVVPPSETLDDQLLARMHGLSSGLLVIAGMTKRGAKLPPSYTADGAIRRMAERVFDALAERRAAVLPWDR
jgi:hypothetical protein